MSQSLSFVLILCSGVIVTSILTLMFYVREQRRQKLLQGIQLLQAGRILVVHLQRHRGFSAAHLAGITANTDEILSLREDISKDLATLSAMDEWFANNENWHGITRHWAALSANTLAMGQEKSFDQHSKLIQAVFQLLSDVAVYSRMEANPRYADTRLIWKEFLLIGELIGQCRALGMDILTAPKDSERQRKKKVLVQNNLDRIASLLKEPLCQRRLDVRQKQQLNEFITYVDAQTSRDLGVVSAMEYFDVVSKAIEMIYEQFDLEMVKLHRKVSA